MRQLAAAGAVVVEAAPVPDLVASAAAGEVDTGMVHSLSWKRLAGT